MIRVENIVKRFGTLEVLHGVTMSVERGEIVSIVGASGAGKTTLLQIIGTLMEADSGSITIDGVSPKGLSDVKLSEFRNKHIGFVFQFHHLLAEFTAVENVDTNVILCRITAIGSRIGYDIYHPGFETSWLGGDYDEENVNAYFGGDPTFLIQFDPDSGEFSIVEYPMIEDEYKANWPED